MAKKCDKTDLTECIRKKAYELWHKEGCKQGKDMEYWLQAEVTIKSQTATK